MHNQDICQLQLRSEKVGNVLVERHVLLKWCELGSEAVFSGGCVGGITQSAAVRI